MVFIERRSYLSIPFYNHNQMSWKKLINYPVFHNVVRVTHHFFRSFANSSSTAFNSFRFRSYPPLRSVVFIKLSYNCFLSCMRATPKEYIICTTASVSVTFFESTFWSYTSLGVFFLKAGVLESYLTLIILFKRESMNFIPFVTAFLSKSDLYTYMISSFTI